MKWWPRLQYLFGAYFVLLGIGEAWRHWELYPWFVLVMFGVVLILDAWSMQTNTKTIDLYKESITLLHEAIDKQSREIIAMQQRLRQWN